MIWAFFVAVALLLPLQQVYLLSGGGLPGPEWLRPMSVFVPAYIIIAVGGFGWRRIRRVVRRADGCLCTNCLYDLSCLPDATACPECGQHGTPSQMRDAWRRSQALK